MTPNARNGLVVILVIGTPFQAPALASEPQLLTLRGNAEVVRAVAFAANGKLLATGGSATDGGLKVDIWDPASGARPNTLEKRGRYLDLSALAFQTSAETLVASYNSCNPCTCHGNAALWELKSPHPKMSLFRPSSPFSSATLSPDGNTLAAASHRTSNGVLAYFFDASVPPPDAFRPKKSGFLETSQPLILFDLTNATIQAAFDFADVSALAFASDGRTLAIATADQGIVLVDTARRKELKKLSQRGRVQQMSFTPDGMALAALLTLPSKFPSGDFWPGESSSMPPAKELVLWDITAAQLKRTLESPTGHFHAIAFSADGRVLATAGGFYTGAHSRSCTCSSNSSGWPRETAGEVTLWDIPSGRELARLNGHSHDVHSVAFSPDGKILATGDADHIIRLWDVTAALSQGK